MELKKAVENLNWDNATENLDWKKIEQETGFPIHQDLKKFYSVFTGKPHGVVNFIEKNFIEKTGNKKFDKWFSFNHCEGNVSYYFFPVTSPQNAAKEVIDAFKEWTGENDWGHRAMIGQFLTNIGDILILFNNDTGKVEWIDCGYGYFDIYEKNPNGILANSMEDFLKKLDLY